jgi:hypothetical protein
MDERWFPIIGLLVAAGVIGLIHWTLSRHGPTQRSTDKEMIRWLEVVVMLCLLGRYVKDEILDVSGKAETHLSAPEAFLYLFGAFIVSLLIYRAFTPKNE